MKNNPLVNAGLALLYILLVVAVVFNLPHGPDGDKPIFIMPVMMLFSLLTLSVAVMGYLFVYQPFCLYMDGEKERAVRLFLQTVGIFAGITVILAGCAAILSR